MAASGKTYHLETGYDRYRMRGHHLDWANRPSLYKSYPGIEPIRLPEFTAPPPASLWPLAAGGNPAEPDPPMDFSLLSRVLMLTQCFTARSRQPGAEFYYRSVASAGALYPCELYLEADHVGGLAPGIYHYGLRKQALSPLRSGSYQYVTQAALGASDTDGISVFFFITGILFRSAWKYRERAFRYVLLDAGHLLENLLLALKSGGFSFSLYYDFEDQPLEALLGIDEKKEVVLASVAVHGKPSGPDEKRAEIKPLQESVRASSGVSDRDVHYGAIETILREGKTPPDPDARPPDLVRNLCRTPERWIPLEPGGPDGSETAYPDVLFRRRSKRNYIDQRLSQGRFARLLDLVCRASGQDVPPGHRYASGVVVGFLAGDIEAVEPGFYLLDPVHRKIGRVFKGYFTSKMASVCLDQEWLKRAAVHFLFMTRLDRIDEAWGARGYRYAMLASGRMGQMIYLGAAALGLGCCGIGALYDGEARELLDLNAASALLYLVAAGTVKQV